MTKENSTQNTAAPTVWHPAWCNPDHCTYDDMAVHSYMHAGTPVSVGRGWDRVTGKWDAKANIVLYDELNESFRYFVELRIDDNEAMCFCQDDLDMFIGYLTAVSTNLKTAVEERPTTSEATA